MTVEQQKIRIGRIDYTNVWPLFYHFCPTDLKSEIEIIAALPSSLNKAMIEGSIDMGPISAFAYGKSSHEYALLANLSVSAYGSVHSILLFLKKPLHDALQGTIALTTTSATSINLMKIIASKFYGATPHYILMDPDLERMMEKADAALLIGDHAIRASWHNTGYEIIDLGALWYKWTGHWMTYAVCVIRKEAILRYAADTEHIVQAFEASKYESIRNPEPLIQDAVRTMGGTPTYWRHYFSHLNYDFGRPQQEGLHLYFQYAYELGLIDQEVHPYLGLENTVG